MTKFSLLFLTINCVAVLNAQTGYNNTAFLNSDSTLYGFKNAKGEVIAEPKFIIVGNESFKDVVSVIEQVSEDEYSNYYLRADGSKFGVDSVYFWDNAPDIESGGYVRFVDPTTKKVGVMHYSGKIAIRAQFDEISFIRNGFVYAIQGARKACWDEGIPIEDCEHAGWQGGQKVLYNVKGELLSTDFFSNSDYVNLDYYTFKKSKKPSKDPNRISFKLQGKGYFSFVNLDKTFDDWVQQYWLKNPSMEQANEITADSVVVWEEENGWTVYGKNDFFTSRINEFRALMTLLKGNNYSYFAIYHEDFYLFEFNNLFGKYFNGAYDFNHLKYPFYTVVVNNELSGEQCNLEFLRTEKGWKMISITLR